MPATRLRAVPEAPPTGAPAADALRDLVSEDAEALASLRRASRHVVPPDREPSDLRQALARRGRRYAHGEVEAAVYEVALDLYPEGWAAARERLRLRVGRAPEGTVSHLRGGGEKKPEAKTEPTPEDAIADLLAEDTACLREVASLSLRPLVGEELLRVSRMLWRALRVRGRHYEGRYFSDHLCAVVKDLFPHSPGARWSPEWEAAIARAAVAHVHSQTPKGAQPVPSEASRIAFERVREAALSEDRRAYRLAVREWVDAELAPFAKDDATG